MRYLAGRIDTSTGCSMYISSYPPKVAVKENKEFWGGGWNWWPWTWNLKNEDNEDIEEFED